MAGPFAVFTVDLREEHHTVFTRPDGRPIDPRDDREEFKELLAEAGIGDRRPYDVSRHTAGTILNELGMDMPTIMEILRHTQISRTRRYVKSRSHRSKDAMRRMGECFVPPPGPHLTPSTETRTEPSDTGRHGRGADASAETKNPSSEML